MNYEEKYNEALQRAKALLDGEASSPGRRKWIGEIFPELAEGLDPRYSAQEPEPPTNEPEYYQHFDPDV